MTAMKKKRNIVESKFENNENARYIRTHDNSRQCFLPIIILIVWVLILKIILITSPVITEYNADTIIHKNNLKPITIFLDDRNDKRNIRPKKTVSLLEKAKIVKSKKRNGVNLTVTNDNYNSIKLKKSTCKPMAPEWHQLSPSCNNARNRSE